MLYRASVRDVKNGALSRRRSHLVVVMQYYPRFLRKDQIDEYVHSLAPDRELLDTFKAEDRSRGDHDAAFAAVSYESRFRIGPEGAAELRRLSELAASKDVFLLCQCLVPEHCHADLLLLLARHWFQAPTQAVRIRYPIFEGRIRDGLLPCPI
jgi:uncharacterized protein YeaO (DUF488 family)